MDVRGNRWQQWSYLIEDCESECPCSETQSNFSGRSLLRRLFSETHQAMTSGGLEAVLHGVAASLGERPLGEIV